MSFNTPMKMEEPHFTFAGVSIAAPPHFMEVLTYTIWDYDSCEFNTKPLGSGHYSVHVPWQLGTSGSCPGFTFHCGSSAYPLWLVMGVENGAPSFRPYFVTPGLCCLRRYGEWSLLLRGWFWSVRTGFNRWCLTVFIVIPFLACCQMHPRTQFGHAFYLVGALVW